MYSKVSTVPGLTLGSRVSPLAMAQARLVQAALSAAHALPADSLPISGFTTTGDRILDRSLQDAGGKGLFTKELDEALLDGRIDAAVHSMKDLPTRLPPGLMLACVPGREDPRDVLVSGGARNLAELPPGARLGSASLRRQAQALSQRPDLQVSILRGSVATRIERTLRGDVDATFLAAAGLNRLGLSDPSMTVIEVDAMLPAVGQGALAVVCRADDRRTCDLLKAIDVADVHAAIAAERAFLDVLDGSCRTPIAAHATIEGGEIRFVGEVLTPDGRQRWRCSDNARITGSDIVVAEALGRRLGAELRRQSGPHLEAIINARPGNWRG